MIFVVGGHSRSVGKTSAVCAIIAATRDCNWTAVKVTQYGHGHCSDHGGECGCAPSNAIHPYSLDEQVEADSTDSGRYLAAGAVRSLWLRTRQGELAEAWPTLRDLMTVAENTIVESNSILALVQPDLFVFVCDPGVDDWKRSARIQFPRADAVVQTRTGGLPRQLRGKPVFDGWNSPQLAAYVQEIARKRITSVTR